VRCLFLLALSVALLATATAQVVPPARPLRGAASTPCLEPPPVVRLEDYNGPLAKFVGVVARKLERRAIPVPRYRPGTVLCSLAPSGKFALFINDTLDPISFLSSGFNAGVNQGLNQDPSFGQGGLGYAKRFGADLAGATASRFFGDFLYPTIFSEDPRYYRLIHGSKKARLLHAVGHTVIGHRDDGTPMFNYAEWLGTASTAALNNLYHPGNEPGVGPAARNGAISVLQDMGFDVLREFWPEIARAFKLPFRGEQEEPLPSPR